MTEKRLEMLKEVRELRKADAIEQSKDNEKKIAKHIEDIIGMDNVKVTRVDNGYDWTTEVEVVDEEGKGIFGAHFTIYYRTKDDKKYIEVNHGCCGSFGKEDKPYIDRIVALSKVLQALDEVKEVYETLPTDKIDAFDEAYWEVHRAENELRKEYAERVEAELTEGKEFTYRDGEKIKVVKVTPKFVTYEYPENEYRNGDRKERKEDLVRKLANDYMKNLDK